MLDITPAQVKRIANAFKEGGLPAAKALEWKVGRPIKRMNFTPKEIEKMVSRKTMYAHAGLAIQARAKAISRETGHEIKACELRQLYKGRGITKQAVRSSFATGNIKAKYL